MKSDITPRHSTRQTMTKWYWLVDCDNTVDEPYVASIGDLKSTEEWKLREGEVLSSWDATAWVKAESPADDGEHDDVLQTYLSVPIYSSRLRRTLERNNIGWIQYLPIQVLRSDGTAMEDFTVANITTCVDALDFEHSKYSMYPADYFLAERRGNVSSLLKPVLIGSELQGQHIVRLRPYRSPKYASQTFKDIFEEGGFTGYSFYEVEVR